MLDSIRVSQDSRTIQKGEWFVSVKGENFDGHDFIEKALEEGAAGVLELEELFDLAHKKIKALQPSVVAVTGSYGKTTTKEAIFEVLSSKFDVCWAKGNLNTPLGLAIEIVNRLRPHHEIFVAEVGMDHLGEIKESCSIINPRVGVVTSVGEMHLEKLGTLGNIKAAKSELLEALPSDGTAVLNYDDSNVREIASKFTGTKVWYGSSPKAEVNFSSIKGLELNLLGEKSKCTALAAWAVGRIFGLRKREIWESLGSFEPPKGRLSLIRDRSGVQIIDDTYNAGPQSMKVALEVLKELPAKRRISLLGDMLELGPLEDDAHVQTLRQACSVSDIVVIHGARMKKASKTLPQDRFAPLTELALRRGDVVLVKGSRRMEMEKIVTKIKSGLLNYSSEGC